MTAESKRLQLVQAARGTAALLVLLYHATITIGRTKYAGVDPLLGLFRFGHAGVDFFFVLSGFIITYAHRSDLGHPASYRRYIWRRLTRIYPAYWSALAVAVVLFILMPQSGPPYARDPLAISLSALLWPQAHLPVLGVAWTLSHEMLFYLIFGFAIFWPRVIASVFVLWQAGVIVYGAVTPTAAVPPFLLYSVNFGFGVGVAIALLSRFPCRWPMAWVGAGTALFLAVGLAENATTFDVTDGNWPQWHFAYVLISGMVLRGLVSLDLRMGSVPRAAVFLGTASYSIYLVHTLVIPPAVKLLVSLLKFPGDLAFPLVVCGALAGGILFYLIVERKSETWARSHALMTRGPMAPRLPIGYDKLSARDEPT